jgi:hypothetical protein
MMPIVSYPEKKIFAAYFRPTDQVIWLIAEAEQSKPRVAGYLIGNEYGGSGTIQLKGLEEKGAIQVLPWTPCSFGEAIDRVRQRMSRAETSERYCDLL